MERKLTPSLKAKDLTVREHIAINLLPMMLATASDLDDPKDVCDEAISIANLLIERLNDEENIR
jgi:hypothetical protein